MKTQLIGHVFLVGALVMALLKLVWNIDLGMWLTQGALLIGIGLEAIGSDFAELRDQLKAPKK